MYCLGRCGNADPCCHGDGCSGPGVLVDSSAGAGAIDYTNDDDEVRCIWAIQCDGLSSPVVAFTQLAGGVTVYDGIGDRHSLPQLAHLSGSDFVQGAEGSVEASGRTLMIRYGSDGSDGDGFALDWSC